jgi:methionyl-tRNA formyltransferase
MMITLVFWGTPQYAVPSLLKLIHAPEYKVLGVVTQPDKRRGRGNQLIPSPVKQVALEHGLQIWQPTRVKKDAQTLQELQVLAADVFVVVAYGQLLSPEILAMPRWGCVNAHGSLLPAYRGAAPIQWSLYNGDTITGVTTMQMDVGMDTGPMLLKRSISVGLLDDAQTIRTQLATVSAELLVETLQQMTMGTLTPEPQADAQASTARLLQKADFLVDWSQTAIRIHNQVRAFIPQVTAQFRGQPLKVLQTVPLDTPYQAALPTDLQPLLVQVNATDSTQSPPGTIVALLKPHGPVVQTGAGLLLLRLVQPAGKRPQSGMDFANGVRLAVGDHIENGRLA